MRDIKTDGRVQTIASVSLLQHSQLVQWERDSAMFSAVSRTAFEFKAERIDLQFGRLMCWISFSTGAEFLAKGLCLLHEIEIRKAIKVPAYPTGDLGTWAAQYRPNSPGTVDVTNFGTLGALLNGQLKQLCVSVKATPEEEHLLMAAYGLLTRSIRNRDAHAYVPKVRDQHFPLVSELFTKCFNLFVSWTPGGPHVLTDWLDNAPCFVASL